MMLVVHAVIAEDPGNRIGRQVSLYRKTEQQDTSRRDDQRTIPLDVRVLMLAVTSISPIVQRVGSASRLMMSSHAPVRRTQAP